MAEQEFIFDLFTVMGPLPSRAEPEPGGAEGVLAVLARQRVAGAAVVSTTAIYGGGAAASGNAAAVAACQAEGGGRLLPAAVVDPRTPFVPVAGVRLLFLLPASQNYPLPYAALAEGLRAAQQANLPVFAEARRPGDATALGAALREVGYAGAPVVLGGVGGDTLHEALTVAKASDRVGIATDGLCGVGEVRYAAQALGAARVFFASGAPLRSLGASVALVKLSGLSPEERSQVFGGNARRLLNLGGGA